MLGSPSEADDAAGSVGLARLAVLDPDVVIRADHAAVHAGAFETFSPGSSWWSSTSDEAITPATQVSSRRRFRSFRVADDPVPAAG